MEVVSCPLNVIHMGEKNHQQWGRGEFKHQNGVFSPSIWDLHGEWLRVSSAIVQEYANNMKHDYDDLFYVRKCPGLKL